MSDLILSIIITSHNQKKELKRCIDSILAQNLPFAHEIIVSDDRSTDDTLALLQTYKEKRPDIFVITQCNSDKCNPAMTSERAGYNRINAYKHAIGKYLVYVDGDDYFRKGDSLMHQVVMLEQHPECTICCQNFIREDLKTNTANDALEQCLFTDGRVLSVDKFISQIPYIHISACCVRNNVEIDKDNLSGNVYDDVDIFYQHIKNGKVVMVDRCEFVYVVYNHLTASKFAPIDQRICWLVEISSLLIAPQCAGSLLRRGLSNIYDVVLYAKRKVVLEKNTINYLAKLPAFIFQVFVKKSSIVDRVRLECIRFWIQLIRKFKLDNSFVYKILYRLAVSYTLPPQINFNRLD